MVEAAEACYPAQGQLPEVDPPPAIRPKRLPFRQIGHPFRRRPKKWPVCFGIRGRFGPGYAHRQGRGQTSGERGCWACKRQRLLTSLFPRTRYLPKPFSRHLARAKTGLPESHVSHFSSIEDVAAGHVAIVEESELRRYRIAQP
jgi:hypothetical protein